MAKAKYGRHAEHIPIMFLVLGKDRFTLDEINIEAYHCFRLFSKHFIAQAELE